ncbi:MAG: glucosaminidase domain-containing protein [Gammaproteobacteria bacterium]
MNRLAAQRVYQCLLICGFLIGLSQLSVYAQTSPLEQALNETRVVGVDALLQRFDQEMPVFEVSGGEGAIPVIPRLIVDELPPQWETNLSIDEKKQVFLHALLPLVLVANEFIMADRMRLLDGLAAASQDTADLPDWIVQLYSDYELEADAGFAELLRRVNIVPPSLALAQAALESGWGTSRFADQANALYGEWVWGSGVVPEEQEEKKGDYGIREFSTLLRSVVSYTNNLNTHPAYEEFRAQRANKVEQAELLSGCELASYLSAYAEMDGEEYAQQLCLIIEQNQLGWFDRAVLENTPAELLQLR